MGLKMTLKNGFTRFLRDRSGAMTIEYVTVAAIGSVLAIAFMYQIGGGDDGVSGLSGLTNAVAGEIDQVTLNIENANLGGGEEGGSGGESGPNGQGLGNGNGQGNQGQGYGNGGPAD